MSWRDAKNPRCPECGEEISATASYCMHCYADLPAGDTETDVSPSDDIDTSGATVDRSDVYGEDAGNGLSTGDSPMGESGKKSGLFGALPSPHSLDGPAGHVASMLWTDVPESEGVSRGSFTAPLWMRVPVAVICGLVAFVVFLVLFTVLLNDIALPGDGWLFLAGLVGIMVWLVRKPLPSDIVGDACYGIALMLLTIPVAVLFNRLVRMAAGADLSLETTGFFAVLALFLVMVPAVLFLVMVPAVLFLVLGYVGNRYARSKLDSAAEQSVGSSST